MDAEHLITTDEAARRLGVSSAAVNWLVHSGRLSGSNGPPGLFGPIQLVEAEDVAAIRGETLERLHGCDTSCVPIGASFWTPSGWYADCLDYCIATGFGVGLYRWARRLGWRLAGCNPARYPGPRGGSPGGCSWAA